MQWSLSLVETETKVDSDTISTKMREVSKLVMGVTR